MKKTIVSILIFLIAALLVGCTTTQADQSSAVQLNQDYPEALPVLTQLVLGTFSLDDTDLAVTFEQATTLLPLWKAVRSLTSSDTSAAEELSALTVQIQNSLTAEQLQAIAAMQLTREDLQTIMQANDISFGSEDRVAGEGFNGNLAPGSELGMGGGPGGGSLGGIPGGGPGGGLGGGVENLTPEQGATQQAAREQRAGGGGFSFLYDALIDFLETKLP